MGDSFSLKLPLPPTPSIIRLRRVFASLAKIGYFSLLHWSQMFDSSYTVAYTL